MTHLVRFKTVALAATFVCVAAVTPLPTMAAYVPVEVAYTIAGSAGNYTLDFSVANNMTLTQAPPDMSVYFFAVQLSAEGAVGHPASFDSGTGTGGFNPVIYGGSNTTYNIFWYNNPGGSSGVLFNTLFPGTTLSGFLVHVTDQTAPFSVPWTAFARTASNIGQYTGGGNFNSSNHPGFEGTAQGPLSPVPVPAAVVLFGSGLLVLGGWQLNRKHQCLSAAV